MKQPVDEALAKINSFASKIKWRQHEITLATAIAVIHKFTSC
jgi:hypothetical protein